MSGVIERDLDHEPEDWRILQTLAVYRLLLLALLGGLYALQLVPHFFGRADPARFLSVVAVYSLPTLVLLAGALTRQPGLRTQAHFSFAIDTLAIVALMHSAQGVSSGLGVLLITPAVGCSLVLPLRLGLLHAALGTFAVFGAEIWRQSLNDFNGTDTTSTGLIGLMLFATSLGAGAVAQRARNSEALAARFGSDLASLARLNERIVESMDTPVLIIDEERRLRVQNAAGRRLLSTQALDGRPLATSLPSLSAAMDRWQAAPGLDPEPVVLTPGGPELLPRFTRLGHAAWAPVLVLLDDAARVREQAQQMKLAALGRLSAGIAHEIRNPLSAIRHAGQLLAESAALPAEDQRLLAMIQRHTTRIDKIVEDVLRLSRRDIAAPETLALRPFLERCIAIYVEGCPGRRCALRVEAIPDTLNVRFDPNQLQQVLHNLWQNSFEHGAADGRPVTVRLAAGRLDPARRPYLDIADDGDGIPAAAREQLFEPFFTTAPRGTGLGLYLSREICEYNQARLTHLPTERGTAFRIVFSS